MKKNFFFCTLFSMGILANNQAGAQGFFKKLKDKVSQATDKVLDKKVADKTGVDPNAPSGSNTPGNTSSPGKPTNKAGEGLKNTTAPDVTQQIADAEKAHDSGNYSDARYSVQQALLGVEIQIGKQILQSLPPVVNNLPKDTAQDIVSSNGWGWANLTIARTYRKDDKQLSVNIGNNSIYGGMLDMLFNNAYGGTQSNGETQNMKQLKIKGNKALIKFDKNEGYTVLVQLGQSGLITWQGINYANEDEITASVNSFDIDGIKKLLGEQ